MCKKRHDVIGEILFLISENECDIDYLADLYSDLYGNEFYFSSEYTFRDLVKDQVVFHRIVEDANGILSLTEKGQLLLSSYRVPA